MKRRIVGTLILVGALLMTLAGCLSSRPRAEFTAVPSSGYPPLEVHFDAGGSRSPNGIITNYEWDFDDGETATGKTAVHTFTEKGVYQVSLAVIDSTGEIGTVYRNVQALSLPPHAEFSVRPNPSTIFFPTDFDASASTDPDGTIVEYIWDFGDATSDEGVIVQHQYTQGSGRWYTVRLTVIDDDGVQSSVDGLVQVLGCDTCGGGG
jgi:PKD repeat protein